MKPERVEHEILLLVEGKDACNFFDTLREHLDLADVVVRDFGGVGQLRLYLAGLVSAPGFRNVRRLGIVRDAEISDDPARTAERAFQSVQSALDNAGLPVPARPAQFIEPGANRPAVAVLILPGGDREGMLETLLCRTFADTPVDVAGSPYGVKRAPASPCTGPRDAAGREYRMGRGGSARDDEG